jgi:hypothetical protein
MTEAELFEFLGRAWTAVSLICFAYCLTCFIDGENE